MTLSSSSMASAYLPLASRSELSPSISVSFAAAEAISISATAKWIFIRSSSRAQPEIDREVEDDVDRFSVERPRLELPLVERFHRRIGERRAAQPFQEAHVADVAVRADPAFEDHAAGLVKGAHAAWIERLPPPPRLCRAPLPPQRRPRPPSGAAPTRGR